MGEDGQGGSSGAVHRGSGGEPLLRRRALAVTILVAAVAASGVGLSTGLRPRAASSPRVVTPRSGAWFCPHGGGKGWRGWAVLTNPGSVPVRVRLTTFGPAGPLRQARLLVPSRRQVFRALDLGQAASSTEVEYFGGWIAAGAVITSGGAGSPLAAERCLPAPSRHWFLPDESTATGQTAFVVVMNPFDGPAEFNVVLRTERQVLAPGELSPYVLPPRTSAAIAVNDFLLQSPSEHTVTAEIESRIGRVVAGGLVESEGTLREEGGVPAVQDGWIIPASGYEPPAELLAMNAGSTRSDLSVIGQGRSAQRLLSGPNGISLAANLVGTFDVGQPRDAGVLAQSTNRRPVALALRLSGPGGDAATVAGAPGAAARWLVLPALPPAGGHAWVLVQNPGAAPAQVTLSAIGPGGLLAISPSRLSSFEVAGGRTVRVPLDSVAGAKPVSVVVHADPGAVVAAGSGQSADGGGFAESLGVAPPPPPNGPSRP